MKSFILRWRLVLVLVAALIVVTAMAGANPAEAATTRTPFDNINVNCVILSQTVWTSQDGTIVHIRDRVMDGAVDSDGDYHEGTTRMVANANIDLATGYGSYWGTLEIYPYAYPGGHWAGHWSVQVNEGKAAGIARLQGYGDLAGLLTKSDLAPILPPFPGYAYLCNGNMPISAAQAVGFVMNPGGE
ncbi:MAG: hypothetical protein ACK2UN_20040 [Candidatus Promineifilaceae bacterium]|jgi:hypothetical protein